MRGMYEQPIHVGFSGNHEGVKFATMTTEDLRSVSVKQGKIKGKRRPKK